MEWYNEWYDDGHVEQIQNDYNETKRNCANSIQLYLYAKH